MTPANPMMIASISTTPYRISMVAPPDALSMIVIGSAIYLIYEVSAVVARIFYHERPFDPHAGEDLGE